MLKSVKFKNFKMFKNETKIDLVSTKSEILRNYNAQNGILRGGLFFGSNASGKTTALNAISILLDMMFKEYVFPSFNICAFSNNELASFEYEFNIDDNEIIYYFSVNKEGKIFEEKLILNNDLKLNRVGDKASTVLINSNQDSPKVVDNKILYLRSIKFNIGFSEFPVIKKWIDYLEHSIYIDNSTSRLVTFNVDTFNETNLAYYLEKYGVKEINEFFNQFDIPFEIEYNKMNVLGQKMTSVNFENLKTKCKIPLQLESYGNKLLLQLLPYILTIKKTGGMLLIDEFGGGMHNKLTELIISYLFKKTINTQIFVVTHETNLLRTNLIRPDQVFIIDYDEKGSSISKASDQSPRESQNLEKMYLAGVFGGIPLYGENK